MERKQITRIFSKHYALASAVLLFTGHPIPALAGGPGSGAASFAGSINCSDSSCHGGAGTTRSEYTRWSKYDFHHERPFATLTTARAARIADNLKISDATQDARCTACHAPLQTVPAQLLGPDNKITEGVSCENCHAPASNWIRSHTRLDWTTADRAQAGMRDLKNLYVRANTCVACHQNVDRATRQAGHPELVFELDGQLANQPRHWEKAKDNPGPQIWLVGQAVALREISWQLAGEKDDPEKNLHDQCEGLLRVLQPLCKLDSHLPAFDASFLAANADNWSGVQRWSDEFAKAAANLTWSDSMTRQCLNELTSDSAAFTDKNISAPTQARYAERLVLGLDRLMTGSSALYADAKLNQSINHLFSDVQSLPDFAPEPFITDLNAFQKNLGSTAGN